jgi:tRNA(Arg) A34 adenosine deaminase TadA
MNERIKWIEINLAKDSVLQNKSGLLGCVIVQKGNLVAKGLNQAVENKDPTAYAEIMAIRNAYEVLGDF